MFEIPEEQWSPSEDLSLWEPPPPVFHVADEEEQKRFRWIPYVEGRRATVAFDSEEAFTKREEFSRFLVKVSCPHCRRIHQPLLSPRTAYVASWWSWVGLEYQQPESGYLCVCPRTRLDYALTIYSPQ
jgi:hypothetical protein